MWSVGAVLYPAGDVQLQETVRTLSRLCLGDASHGAILTESYRLNSQLFNFWDYHFTPPLLETSYWDTKIFYKVIASTSITT